MGYIDDWAPLADRDPIPGNPDEVAELGNKMKASADTIDAQLQRLRSINSEEFWSGIAADRFKEHQEEIRQPLEQQALRHRKASAALLAYAPCLGEAKSMARCALRDAQGAQDCIAKAENGINDMEAQTKKAQCECDEWNAAHPELPPRQPDPWWGPNWHGEFEQGSDQLRAARALLAQAIDLRNSAADKCASEIGNAIHDGLRNRGGFWNSIKRGAGSFAKLPLVKTVTDGVGIAAAIVGVAAIVFPILAPLAIGLGAVALVLDSVAAIGGVGSWRSVAMDVFGLATMGAGRFLDSSAKAMKISAKASKGLNLAQSYRAEAEGLKATVGIKNALQGMKVVTAEGKTIYGAAARSAKLKQLHSAAEAAQEAVPNLMSRSQIWREAFSPRAFSDEFIEMLKLGRDPIGGLRTSFQGLREAVGFTPQAQGVVGLERQSFMLKRAAIQVDAYSAALGGQALVVDIRGDQLDDAAARRGEEVTPVKDEL
jgi:uncharacterized protein YukE